jgi:signal transduction histidine kinase
MLLHLGYFFFAALMCHGQLAADRPGARYLAEFYVWLSLGGVLGGVMRLEILDESSRCGLQLIFEDEGPGIADVELALQNGYTTGDGLGLGLGGSRRLCDEFEIITSPEQGTQVRIVKWK